MGRVREVAAERRRPAGGRQSQGQVEAEDAAPLAPGRVAPADGGAGREDRAPRRALRPRAGVSRLKQTCRMRYDHIDIPPVLPHLTRVALQGGRCGCGPGASAPRRRTACRRARRSGRTSTRFWAICTTATTSASSGWRGSPASCSGFPSATCHQCTHPIALKKKSGSLESFGEP
jgi:hypothetical protein